MATRIYMTKDRKLILDLMARLGPVSIRGAVEHSGLEYKAAEKVLRKGAAVGLFEELPAAPTVFVPGPNAPKD